MNPALVWDATTWTAIGSIATALLALGTFLSLRQGRKERQQIVADRELQWRPALSGVGFDFIPIKDSRPPPNHVDCRLANAGGGPAIGARVMWSRDSDGVRQWYLSTPLDIPAGANLFIESAAWIDDSVATAILASIPGDRDLAGVIVCGDFLDRRWCFPLSSPESGNLPKVLAPLSGRGWKPSGALVPFARFGLIEAAVKPPRWATDEVLWQ